MICLNSKFVSSSFYKIVNILEKYYGSNLKYSDLFEYYLDYIKKIKKYCKNKVVSRTSYYRQINEDSFENYINKEIGNLPISRELKRVDKSGLFVSRDYNSLYPSAMAHKDSKWPKIETTIAIKKEDSLIYVNYLLLVNGKN